ncbi:tyrosine-protein kinase [Flammeovirgaceae bacterium 311]|nr:tyrosine-protein kinase [Flammeovirgaceae bacterium 311]
MEEIDVKIIFRKVLRKWYLFVLSLTLTLGLAFFYLATTQQVYLVESTIQLKDQSLIDNGAAHQKFLSGLELFASDPLLEDEIGILSSYATINQTVERLGMEVSYFRYPALLGTAGKVFAKEVYPAPFDVELDSSAGQLMYTPIHITFPDEQHYRVQISGKDKLQYLYYPLSRGVVSSSSTIELDTVLSVQQALKTPYLSFSLGYIDASVLESTNAYYFIISSPDKITENFRKQLKCEQLSEKSNIVKLSLHSAVPERDVLFLKVLSHVYIENDLKKKNRLGEKTIEFIDFQLQGVTDSLRSAETTLEAFRAKSNIIDVERTSHTLSDQLFSLEERQAQLMVQNKYYQYMSDYLARNDDISDIVAPSSVGIQDELLNSLLIQLSTLNEEKIGKDFSSSKQNPVMQVLEKKIRNTKQSLIDNIENLIGSNNIALQESSRRLAELKRTISKLPENERNLTDIKRRFAFNDNIYNYLLQKKAEAGIAIASNVPNKSVIDAARQIGNAPVGAGSAFVLFIAGLLGLLMPVGFIFVSELFQTKLESDDQLEKWTDISLVERIALLKSKELNNRYTGESYLAHAFRYVRHHIDFLRLNQQVKVVGISSAKSGEGKTFCALNLAITFAHAGQKTLLIDADLHHPALASKLNIDTTSGLGEYLSKEQQPVISKTDYTGLSFLCAGKPQENASDLLAHPRLGALMATLREQYDVIILDAPPVGIVADYLQLGKHTDYTFLVVRQDYTQRDELHRLTKLVKRHSIHCGIIYNGAAGVEEYSGYYKKKV